MFEKEIEIGRRAVLSAMRAIEIVQKNISLKDSPTKADRSPVTIADFTSQAIVCRILNHYFENIPIVAEEDSSTLRKNSKILQQIYSLIEQNKEIKKILPRDNLFDSIDLGGQETDSIFWTLDPLDGTKGFLRGEQFSIALALIVEGKIKIGILGCPRLSLPQESADAGLLFSSIKGKGTEVFNLKNKKYQKAKVSDIVKVSEMRFIQSYVSAHSDSKLQAKIAKILQIKNNPVHMDSQVKYGLVASGHAEIYLRIPHPRTPDYKEKIWDHAAGSILVEEAGGVVSDIFGKKLDFQAGKTLNNNYGILATVPGAQRNIIEIIQQVSRTSQIDKTKLNHSS